MGKFCYGNSTVFGNVNLKINSGDIIAIVGSNGSGKTTLLKCLANIYELDSGEIVRNERDSVVFVPDVPKAYEYLTGYEYLLFIQSITNTKNLGRIKEILSEYTLYHEKDKMIKDYSHGMRQKLSLCASLINENVDYILLDEPLTGIDAKSQSVIIENFRKLSRNNKSIILSTHQIDTLKKVCNRIYYLESGEEEYVRKGTY